MNSSFGHAMRKVLHDEFSSGSLNKIDTCSWSKNKTMLHPTRTTVDTHFYTVAGKICLSEELIEAERRVFGNAEYLTFAEDGEDCDMRLLDKENVFLLLKTRTFCSRSIFRCINDLYEK